MEPCTCHISNLRCKSEKCSLLITFRGLFKTDVGNMLGIMFKRLHEHGFEKKDCIRALRREVNHRNSLQHDVFDEIANTVWKE